MKNQISKAAIEWLQSLLRQRVHPDLLLHLEQASGLWKISCSGNRESIAIPFFPALYRHGHQPELPCDQWCPASEGFCIIEPQLPAPGLAEIPKPLIQHTVEGVSIRYDVLGLTYWMLTRCEELNPIEDLLDNHGRFESVSSHAKNNNYLERPIVDEWFVVLRQLVQRLWPRLPLLQHHFRIIVSHDVDSPSRFGFATPLRLVKRMTGSLLLQGDWKSVFRAPFIRFKSSTRLHPADPYNTFEWLMDLSEASGLRSAFYFMSGRTNLHFDAEYELDHPAIRALMHRIHERGHEVITSQLRHLQRSQRHCLKLFAFGALLQKKAFSSGNGAAACIFCVGSGLLPLTVGSKPAFTTTALWDMLIPQVFVVVPAIPSRCSTLLHSGLCA